MIRVTLRSGNKIRINPMLIEAYGLITEESFDAKECNGYTFIIPAGSNGDTQDYVVKESPEEIDSMIRNWRKLWMSKF